MTGQGEAGEVLGEILRPYELEELREVREWAGEDRPGAHNIRWLLELVDRLCLEVAEARDTFAAERDELGRDWHRRLNEVAAERDRARADGAAEERERIKGALARLATEADAAMDPSAARMVRSASVAVFGRPS